MDAMTEQKGTGDLTESDSSPMFGEALDSWEPRFRPETEKELKLPVERKDRRRERQQEKKEPEIQEKVPEILEPKIDPDSDFVTETRTVKRMKKAKARRICLSVSMSDEEAQLLRRHAASLDLNFSSWARRVLFRAMGRKVPARPKRD
jgi:hypothetical protein